MESLVDTDTLSTRRPDEGERLLDVLWRAGSARPQRGSGCHHGRRLVGLKTLIWISLWGGIVLAWHGSAGTALACSSHGTQSGNDILTDAGIIAIEDSLVPPNVPTECVAGIGLGSPTNPLPPQFRVTGLAIAIRDTVSGDRTSFAPFNFSANSVTTRDLAAGSGSTATPGTNPLFDGSTWFGFSSPVDPFLLPQLGPDEVLELSFSFEVPEALLPLSIEVQFAAGEGLEDGTPLFGGGHPVQYFSGAATVIVLQAGVSVHEITGVLDGAASLPLISPGAIVSVFGSFAERTATSPRIPLSTTLDGLVIRVGGLPAPVFIVIRGDEVEPPLGFDQANVQVPWEVDPTGTVDVELEWTEAATGTISSETFAVNAAQASPGIFTFEFGPGPAIVQNFSLGNDDVIAGSFAHAEAPLPGLVTQPAVIGGAITVWSNGLGPVTGTVATGDVPALDAPLSEMTKPVRLLIGGEEATIIGKPALHPTLVALYQINAFVPEGVAPGEEVAIRIEVDCGEGEVLASRDDVFIAVRPAP